MEEGWRRSYRVAGQERQWQLSEWVRWSCLSRRNVWLLPLPRGENDNQERRSSIAHMSEQCVYTTGKRCAVGHADGSEGVTMRSGRRVNDDTLGNLNPTTACFDVSLGRLSARRARKGRTILHALPFRLSLGVRLSQFEGRRASFLRACTGITIIPPAPSSVLAEA